MPRPPIEPDRVNQQPDDGRRLPASTSRRLLSLLSLLFLAVVIAIVSFRSTLFLPLYLALASWAKIMLKSVTPKLLMLFVKNSVVIKLRQILVSASTQFFVMSHRPWRRRLLSWRASAVARGKTYLRRYLRSPLWFRTVSALSLLALTASSSYAFIAILIIPQPILNWFQRWVMTTLNKLGVTQLFNAVWKFLIPESWRRRWLMYRKWTLGRRQVLAARRLREQVSQKARQLPLGSSETSGTATPE